MYNHSIYIYIYITYIYIYVYTLYLFVEYWIRPICYNVLTIQTRTFKDPGSQAGPRACDRSICRHFLQSKCTFGDLCQFSHEVPELTSAPPGQTLKNQGPQRRGTNFGIIQPQFRVIFRIWKNLINDMKPQKTGADG